MSSNIMSVYIPRILGNISRDKIIRTFKEKQIGNVFYLDMHYKVNNNNNPYYFAFLKIDLFQSKEAIEFRNDITDNEVNRLYYNANDKYWEIKKYLERDKRSISPIGVDELEKEIYVRNVYTSFYTYEEKMVLEQEYAVLERDIFALM